jgi:peptide/nickel transport system permease protein
MLAIVGRQTARFGAGLIGAVVFAAALAALGAAGFTDALIDRVVGIASLDFGPSTISGSDSFASIIPTLADSAILFLPGLGLALVLGVPLGVLLADKHTQAVAGPLTQLARAVPVFCAALLFGVIAAAFLPGIEPGRGMSVQDAIATHNLDTIMEALAAMAPLVLPIALAGAGAIAAIVCGAMEEALGENYRQSLQELGIGPREILRTYVARRALALSLAAVGDVLLVTVGALAIVERLFDWPGAGAQFIHAAALHDWPVVGALVFVIALGRIVADFIGGLMSTALTGSAQ